MKSCHLKCNVQVIILTYINTPQVWRIIFVVACEKQPGADLVAWETYLFNDRLALH